MMLSLSLSLLEVDATSLTSGPRHPCPASALDPGPGVEVHTNPSQASRFLHAYLLIRVVNTCNSTLIGSVLLFSDLPVSFVILPTSSERRQYWVEQGRLEGLHACHLPNRGTHAMRNRF